MHPVLLHTHNFVLWTYDVFFAAAFFVGLGTWVLEGKHFEIPPEKIIKPALSALFFGWLGARGLFLLTQWSMNMGVGSFSIWNLFQGGIVFLGGLVLASFVLWMILPRELRWGYFESAAPAIAFAQAIGRFGCSANGCCYGRPSHLFLAVVYRDRLAEARPLGVPLHPSQLYEAFGLIVLGGFLVWNNRRAQKRFSSLQIYLFGYGILRFLVEMTRGDDIRGKWGFLSTSQWLSLVLILTALLLDYGARTGHNLRHEKRS